MQISLEKAIMPDAQKEVIMTLQYSKQLSPVTIQTHIVPFTQ